MSTALLIVQTTHWVAAILLLSIAGYTMQFRRRTTVLLLGAFCFLSGLWALCSALIIVVPELTVKTTLNRIKLTAPILIPLVLLALAMTIHGKKSRYVSILITVAIVPLVSLLLILSPHHHDLLIGNYRLVTMAGQTLLAFDNGPWFAVHNFNSRLIALVSMALLVLARRDVSTHHRNRIWLVIIVIAIPFIGDSIAVHFVPMLRYIQLTPALLLISGILLIYAIFDRHLVDVVPLAKTKILDSLGDIYLTFNEHHELVDFNAKAEICFQLSRMHLGKTRKEILTHGIELEELLSLDLGSGSCEWYFLEKTYEVSLNLIQNKNAVNLGYVIVCKDITLLKREEKNLKNLNKIKSTLLAVIGHDFRGNLSASAIIIQNLSKNFESMADEDILLALQNLEKVIKQNVILVGELLEWSRPQLSAPESKCTVNLENLVESTRNFVCQIVQERQIVIDFEIEGTKTISTDGTILQIILRNLLINAIKASPENAKVHVRMHSKGGVFSLLVEDQGKGIAKNQLADIFQIKKQSNTGIGLFLCHEFVTNLGGKIWVESELGIGSRFYVTIPIEAKANLLAPQVYR